jgi:hypothetical protein
MGNGHVGGGVTIMHYTCCNGGLLGYKIPFGVEGQVEEGYISKGYPQEEEAKVGFCLLCALSSLSLSLSLSLSIYIYIPPAALLT